MLQVVTALSQHGTALRKIGWTGSSQSGSGAASSQGHVTGSAGRVGRGVSAILHWESLKWLPLLIMINGNNE